MEFSLRIAAELENLAAIRRFIEEAATALGSDSDTIFQAVLAVDEAATNIVTHGYQGQPGIIEIQVEQKGSDLAVRLRDQAPVFDPTTVPPPDVTQPLEHRSLGGMGVHLMRNLMDEMTHHRAPQGGNELILIKKGVF